MWSVPSWPALCTFQVLNLEFSVACSCVAMLRHQNTSQCVRNDYQNLLENCHECSNKNISSGWGECRNRREVCEKTEQNANTEEWQRYYQGCQDSLFTSREAVEFACALGNEDKEANVDDQEDDEAGFDQFLPCTLFGNRAIGQIGATDNTNDECDCGRELEELEEAAAVGCRKLVHTESTESGKEKSVEVCPNGCFDLCKDRPTSCLEWYRISQSQTSSVPGSRPLSKPLWWSCLFCRHMSASARQDLLSGKTPTSASTAPDSPIATDLCQHSPVSHSTQDR